MTAVKVAVERVRRNFSAHAGEYDHYAQVQKRVAEALLARLSVEAAWAGPVLDLGTGTGELGRRFRALHPGSPLLLADLAHGMTCCAAGHLPDALAFDATAESLPLSDATLGLVLSSSMYQWVDDLSCAFAEVYRVLKPGGTFALALFGSESLAELRFAHETSIAETGGCGASAMQNFPTSAQVQAALDRAGFSARLEIGYEIEIHEDVPTLLRQLKHIGAQNAVAGRSSGLGGRLRTLRMMEIYTKRFQQCGRIPATWQVISAVARKAG